MNFDYSEEQLMIKKTACDYAQRELFKDVIERDTNSIYPVQHIKNIAQLGFFGMLIIPEYGGVGLDNISYALALEEISKVDSSIAVIMSVHNSLTGYGIETYGTKEQKDKYLPILASGEKIGAFLLSEPDAGSDASFQKTTAIDNGDHYIINGIKNWITSANTGGIYVVIAQTWAE